MSGSRTKKLRKEAYKIYMETLARTTIRHRKNLLPFNNIFKQIKGLYNQGIPTFKTTQMGIGWPTKR